MVYMSLQDDRSDYIINNLFIGRDKIKDEIYTNHTSAATQYDTLSRNQTLW